jgi:hypothetical protein
LEKKFFLFFDNPTDFPLIIKKKLGDIMNLLQSIRNFAESSYTQGKDLQFVAQNQIKNLSKTLGAELSHLSPEIVTKTLLQWYSSKTSFVTVQVFGEKNRNFVQIDLSRVKFNDTIERFILIILCTLQCLLGYNRHGEVQSQEFKKSYDNLVNFLSKNLSPSLEDYDSEILDSDSDDDDDIESFPEDDNYPTKKLLNEEGNRLSIWLDAKSKIGSDSARVIKIIRTKGGLDIGMDVVNFFWRITKSIPNPSVPPLKLYFYKMFFYSFFHPTTKKIKRFLYEMETKTPTYIDVRTIFKKMCNIPELESLMHLKKRYLCGQAPLKRSMGTRHGKSPIFIVSELWDKKGRKIPRITKKVNCLLDACFSPMAIRCIVEATRHYKRININRPDEICTISRQIELNWKNALMSTKTQFGKNPINRELIVIDDDDDDDDDDEIPNTSGQNRNSSSNRKRHPFFTSKRKRKQNSTGWRNRNAEIIDRRISILTGGMMF